MADAAQAITSFLGGEISPYAQGRFDRPDYKISMNVCLNSFPLEIGAWNRRPGTQHAGNTRGGNKGRVLEFDFEQSVPNTLEFTDGWLRFRSGSSLLTTNDTQTVSGISTANPAVVNTAAANTWATGNTVIFPPGVPLLENRQFTITVIDSQHFSLQDALTGNNIDGSTLGTIPALTVQRVQELQTVYGAGSWASQTMRSVQAETVTFLLNNSVAPQAVTVSALPTLTTNATFAISAVTFNDGPYLDPFTNGVRVTPGATSGIVTMTLSFPTYSSTIAYPIGAFVVSSGTNYVSLQDQNVNNTPASSPTFWAATSIGAAINNGSGLSNTDVGRLVRFFNEPALWDSGTTYATGNIVQYNPSGIPGEETYWSSLTSSNAGNVPGEDATHWSLLSVENAAIWTWGKITSLSTAISGSTGTNIGNMTGGGGLAGAFNGNSSQNNSASAKLSSSTDAASFSIDGYVGKNYSSGSQKIGHVVVYPSVDSGLGVADSVGCTVTATLNLRASNSLPSSASNGTLLGTSSLISNTLNPITINSNDTSTSYQYAWVETVVGFSAFPLWSVGNFYVANAVVVYNGTVYACLIANTAQAGFPPSVDTSQWETFTTQRIAIIGQLVFFNPTGVTSGASFNVEILGPSLLYESLITTWRMGAYGGPNGYPTCGCYAEGRLWLGGAIANRFDASVSNGISGSTVNFAPTDQFGVVSDSNAIDETLNSDSVNPIIAMKPDLQGVVMLTQNGEWLVQAPTTGSISPLNIAARRMTKHGAANIESIRTPHSHIFVKRYGQKLLEYFADAFSGKYSAPNLADKASHITANVIAELAYTDGTTPIVWGRDNIGNLFGLTYKRDTLVTSQLPDFYAWHRHVLGTGRVVESICSGASVGGNLDALTIVTNDPAANIRHVEVLTDIPNETTPFLSSWFLDDAVNPTSVSNTGTGLTINGLWHLNGKTVQVFAGGIDCGDIGDLAKPFLQNFSYSQNQYVRGSNLNIYQSVGNKNIGNDPTTDGGVHWTLIGTGLDFVVSNGSITVPYGDGVAAGAGAGLFTQTFAVALSLNQIVVGMTYNSDGQIVRPQTPAETGTRAGPALGKISRDHFLYALLVNTLGISFGTDFSDLIPARFTQEDEVTLIPPLTTYSGIYTDIPNSKHSRYGQRLCWRVNRPMPAAIVAIGASRASQDQ